MAPQIERPLSPFMTYRWTLTMAMSIVHRITGIARETTSREARSFADGA